MTKPAADPVKGPWGLDIGSALWIRTQALGRCEGHKGSPPKRSSPNQMLLAEMMLAPSQENNADVPRELESK